MRLIVIFSMETLKIAGLSNVFKPDQGQKITLTLS
jgi:hypothetical protein